MLTVHKSKGLEFKHVFFLGIDDKFWWAHSPGDSDGLSTFFVGLSRARRTVRFTYCAERGPRSKVSDLYEILAAAAVQELAFG
jgi:superfamily I DNA/RNA helicase